MTERNEPTCAPASTDADDRRSAPRPAPRFLDRLFARSGIGMAIARGETMTCVAVNEAFGQIAGGAVPCEGLPLPDLFVGDARSDWMALARRAASGGPAEMREFHCVRPDGEERWWNIQVLPESTGDDGFALVLAYDVTPQVLARREAQQSARQAATDLGEFRTVLEHMDQGVVVFRLRDAAVLFHNRAALDLHGVDLPELLVGSSRRTERLFELADLGGRVMRGDRWPASRLLEGETTVEEILWVLRRETGRQRALAYSGRVIRDTASGEPLAVLIVRDETDRLRAEQALREGREDSRIQARELDTIYQAVPVGLSVLDRQGRLIKVNRALAEINAPLGADDVPLEPDLPTLNEQLRPAIEQVFRTGRAVTGLEITGSPQYQPGRRRTWLVHYAPLINPDGHVDRLVCVTQDITDRKRTETALQELTESLERQVAERTAVAERRSQQLREMAAELTHAEQHERKRLAEFLHDHLQQLLVGAKFHVGAMEDDLGPPDSPARPLQAQVSDLLDECLQACRSLTFDLSPNVPFEENLPATLQWLADEMAERYSLLVNVSAEPLPDVPEPARVLLFQSVRELLFNVAKHAQVREAFVDIRHEDGQLLLTVRDAGAGFDPKRVSRKPVTAGGIGLQRLQERIHVMGGDVLIKAAPGQGSEFTIRLPLELG